MPLSKVNTEVQELANKLQPVVAEALKTGADAALGEEAFNNNLPEDITIDVVKRVQKIELDFVDALALATSEASIELMSSDKKRDIHSVTAKVGTSDAKIDFRRSRDVKSPSTGEAMTVYGNLSAGLVSGIGAKRGNYAKIKTAMAAKAKSVFDN